MSGSRATTHPVVTVSMAVVLLLMLFVDPGQADEAENKAAAAKTAQGTVTEAINIGQDEQNRRNAWETEKSGLKQRYQKAQADAEYFEDRVVREQAACDALGEKVDELERRLFESTRLADCLQDSLVVVLDRLTDQVAVDLPFLPREREHRLVSVRKDLDDPTVPVADKLRRVLEAYQVEAQYGGTIELVSDQIFFVDREIHVDILRVGRLALFWRTPDGSKVGAWDQSTELWVELPRNSHRAIAEAMDMAARMRPVQVIGLPLGRIER